jgi:Phosphotransferase enzyme family
MSWHIAAIVVDDETRSVLVDRAVAGDAGGPRLPSIGLPPRDLDGEGLIEVVEGLIGRSVTPIWLRYNESDDPSKFSQGLLLTAADRAVDATDGREFVQADHVVDTLEPEIARGPIRAWLDRLDGRGDPRTPSWMEPGWFDRVSTWIAERLIAAGMPPTEPTRMTYQSPIGTVLRTRSGDWTTYLKCSAPHFRAEASITRALGARTPAWIPEVIEIEPAQGWLLMADFAGRILGRDPELDWVAGLSRIAELQRAWVDDVEELVVAGAQRRPLADLTRTVPGLLERDGLAERIGASVLERWPELLLRFTDACHELEDMGLPDGLVHGDAHPWNIAVAEHGLIVFDWSDGAAGPSFVDIAVFIRRTKDLALRRLLRDAYVDVWSGAAPRARLERACELAMAVGALYQVVTYQALLPSLPPEDRVVYGGSDRGWFRAAVDGLEHGLDAVGLPAD